MSARIKLIQTATSLYISGQINFFSLFLCAIFVAKPHVTKVKWNGELISFYGLLAVFKVF